MSVGFRESGLPLAMHRTHDPRRVGPFDGKDAGPESTGAQLRTLWVPPGLAPASAPPLPGADVVHVWGTVGQAPHIGPDDERLQGSGADDGLRVGGWSRRPAGEGVIGS